MSRAKVGRIRVRPGLFRTETLYVTRTAWTESGRISLVATSPTPAISCDDRTDRTETGRNQEIDVSPNLDGGRSGYIDSRPPPSNDHTLVIGPQFQFKGECVSNSSAIEGVRAGVARLVAKGSQVPAAGHLRCFSRKKDSAGDGEAMVTEPQLPPRAHTK